MFEFVVDVEEPLRESAKFTAILIFQLGLDLTQSSLASVAELYFDWKLANNSAEIVSSTGAGR